MYLLSWEMLHGEKAGYKKYLHLVTCLFNKPHTDMCLEKTWKGIYTNLFPVTISEYQVEGWL